MRYLKLYQHPKQVALTALFAVMIAACGAGDPLPVEEQAVSSAPEEQDEQIPSELVEGEPATAVSEQGVGQSEFTLTSAAFTDGEAIPPRYSCDGENISPMLEWRGAPQGVESFALVMDDPDAPAGTWVHWVLFDIPPGISRLEEGLVAAALLPDGSAHGANSWKRSDYGGPCPPSGTHRYFFKLYALDRRLDLPSGSSMDEVQAGMQGHILVETSLMGTFTR